MKALVLFFVLAISAASAVPIVVADGESGAVAVADRGQLSVHDAASGVLRFRVPIELSPTSGVAGHGEILLLDAIANRGLILDLASRRSRRFDTAETPVDAVAFGNGFLILARDSSSLTLEHLNANSRTVQVAPQSTLLETSRGNAFTYSPSSGEINSFDSDLRALARGKAQRGASDLEVAGNYLYLVFPKRGRIDAHDRRTLLMREHFSGGAVPLDLLASGDPNVLGAGTLTIADPSSKRIWREEGSQSEIEAFSRGVLRGMLGLGLYNAKSTEIPTGVDRLFRSARVVWAYDTTTRTLYRTTTKKITKAAANIDHRAIAPDGRGGVWIVSDGERLRRVQ